MNRRRAIALLSLVVFTAGCADSVAWVERSGGEPGAAASTTIPTVTPTPAATSTARADASALPSPSETAAAVDQVAVDDVAVTVVAGLRVRSKPRVSDESAKLDPVLPIGTPLYVLDGPVSASGYTWYEVAPLASKNQPHGWVAKADRSGEPWLSGSHFSCPPVPTDFRSLAALPAGVGLACYPR